MDIYSTSSLTVIPVKAAPDVWVRRVVIYRQLLPHPVVIREIPLTRGVNIVWAEESDDEGGDAEITGHSAGKTSFCRLLRYLLGEKTFGTEVNSGLIQKRFPNGYVAAELFVRQKQWAVIRPIGVGRNSYVKPDATVEDLVRDRLTAITANQDDYPSKLGLDELLNDMDAGAVLRTNKAIEWGHVLAWCTRDQEARFQNCFEWRSPRSDSEWPSFRSSKSDPLFVMRMVLGLFLPNELKGEEELAALTQTREELEKKLPLLRHEPRFRVNLYQSELRSRLRKLLPTIPDFESLPFRSGELFAQDLDKLTSEASRQLNKNILEAQEQRNALVRQIETASARMGVLEYQERQLAALFKLDSGTQNELKDGLGQRQRERELFEKAGAQSCILGGVLYRDCPIVQDRQEIIQMSRLQDASALQQLAIKRAAATQLLNNQRQELLDEVASLRKQRSELQRERESLESSIQASRNSLRDLATTHQNLNECSDNSDIAGTFKELDECREAIKKTAVEIETMQKELNALIAQHDTSRKLISSIFSAVVRGVIPSGAYDGEVTLADRELTFKIMHGTTMSGEAVETLAVLLADVACLIYNSVSERSRLPGFLLHDSPREADLSLRLYRRFIALAASLQKHFDSADQCPFQYIITTTTPPPDELQSSEWVKLHLNAAIPDESLFRCNLALVPENEMRLGDAVGNDPQ